MTPEPDNNEKMATVIFLLAVIAILWCAARVLTACVVEDDPPSACVERGGTWSDNPPLCVEYMSPPP